MGLFVFDAQAFATLSLMDKAAEMRRLALDPSIGAAARDQRISIAEVFERRYRWWLQEERDRAAARTAARAEKSERMRRLGLRSASVFERRFEEIESSVWRARQWTPRRPSADEVACAYEFDSLLPEEPLPF